MSDTQKGSNDAKKNKFVSNNRYFTISIYMICVILVGAIIIKSVFNWGQTSALFKSLVSALSPFIYGILIAYLINPLLKFINHTILAKWLKIKSKKVRNGLSLLLSYIFVIGMIFMLLNYVIPQILVSLYDIAVQLPGWYKGFESWLAEFFSQAKVNFPYIDFTWVEEAINGAAKELLTYSNISSIISNTLPLLLNTSVSIIKLAINIVLAIMISCYSLIDKKLLTRSFSRGVYAILGKERTEKFITICSECNAIFSGYIYGKTIDALIIGIIAFIGLTLLGINYAPLLATVIGLFNMIPYIGPIIGAIPGAIILVMVSPVQMLIYLIFILLLQQFDGIYLSPKILGNSTGLRPLWIIFAITVGGAVEGIWGMFLGVPIVAVIGHLIDKFFSYRLKKLNIDESIFSKEPEEKPEEEPEKKE